MKFKVVVTYDVQIPNKEWYGCRTDKERIDGEIDELKAGGYKPYIRSIEDHVTGVKVDIVQPTAPKSAERGEK